jgi:hypothetical protein
MYPARDEDDTSRDGTVVPNENSALTTLVMMHLGHSVGVFPQDKMTGFQFPAEPCPRSLSLDKLE